MKNRKNRKNIVIILASLLIFALAVSLAYFTDYWSSEEYGADADTLGFEVIKTKEEALTLMAPGDARFFNYQVKNVKGLAMDVRATFEMEDLSNVDSQTGGFSVYDAADVLGYNYDQGYTLREGAAPLVNSLDPDGAVPYDAGVIHGLNDKPNVFPEGLFFSAYLEGTSNNKAIELFNGYTEAINLADYEIQLFNNGHTSPDKYIRWASGEVGPGETYLIVHSSAEKALKDKADRELSNLLEFNGNDALLLLKNGKVADRFGIVGDDPGSAGWGGVTTDRTLVRKTSVLKGRVAPYTEFIPSDEWVIHGVNDYSVLKNHTVNMTDATWRCLDIDLVVVLEEDSGNEWQGAGMKLTTTIEGRQYRNATDPNGKGGW